MRNSLVVGILKETKYGESRAPLSPSDVAWLTRRYINVEVESNPKRIFPDKEYKKAGAKIVNQCNEASLLVGVKEPPVFRLKSNKIYMVFSHTMKGQSENIPLLKGCIDKGITLIDYEKIMDPEGKRFAYFGKFAGVCGCIDSLAFLGKKLQSKNIPNPFSMIKTARAYKTYNRAQVALEKVARRIHQKGFDQRISPFIIGISGYGNVGRGVVEILKILKPVEIHPRDLRQFVFNQKRQHNKVYQIVFNREENLISKDGRGYYFEEYLEHPERFESNMDRYLPYINILLHTNYWDKRFPRLVTKDMIHKIWKGQCRLDFIGDIACDVNGSIQLTYKTTTEDNPVYTYNPRSKKYTSGYKVEGITILARDNLPAELPKDASEDFSSLIREYVYQIAAHGVTDVTNHVMIPREVRNGIIVQNHRLTKPYGYLRKFLG